MRKPHVIQELAVYTLASAAEALGLPGSCLPREVRLGRLRVAKRSGRYFLLGAWLVEWLRSGEVLRRQQSESNGVPSRSVP
jgi:hypothetical protein